MVTTLPLIVKLNFMRIDKQLLKTVFKSLYDSSSKNISIISGVIHSNLSDEATDFILRLMDMDHYDLLYLGCYVKMPILKDKINLHYEVDILSDMGLYEDGYVYGKILYSGSWERDDFNSFEGTMQVECYGHDKNNKLKTFSENIKTGLLTFINKEDIKYFK